MVMSGGQNAERGHNIKIDNSLFERVERIKIFGARLIYEISIQEHTKWGLNLGNVC
jgi:hypothetical protein